MERKTTQLIKEAEMNALEEMNRLSYSESTITKGQIVDRIRDINQEIRGFDILIESKTFQELLNETGLEPPKLNDRILLVIKTFKEAINEVEKDVFELIEKSLPYIFEWDEKIHIEIKEVLLDLKKYIELDLKNEQKLIEFTRYLMQKYEFNHDIYSEINKKFTQETRIEDKFFATVNLLEKFGPILSIYESLKKTLEEKKIKVDVVLAVLIFVTDFLQLDIVSAIDLIPTLLRSLMRKFGKSEEDALKMYTYEMRIIAKRNPIGVILLEICELIDSEEKDEFFSSLSGTRLWYELHEIDFWNATEYLPRLAYINGLIKDERPSLDKEINKINPEVGKLADALYT